MNLRQPMFLSSPDDSVERTRRTKTWNKIARPHLTTTHLAMPYAAR